MAEENLNRGIWNRVKKAFAPKFKAVNQSGFLTELSRGEINKALEPDFLYNPPFGYPQEKNIYELRRLAAVPYVEMCIATILDEMTSVEWNIVADDDESQDSKEKEIEEVTNFFENPNTNSESFEKLLRKAGRDILEIDSGVLVKQFNLAEKLVGLVAKDGGTFTKNPDIFGMFTDREELLLDYQIVGNNKRPENMDENMITQSDVRNKAAYFQYGWRAAIRPIPFGKREIVWLERNPRTDSFYGRSPIENLYDAIQLLLYAIDSNLDYYKDNNIPKGVLGIDSIPANELDAFAELWKNKQQTKDPAGNWKKRTHYVPMVNRKVEYARFQLTNAELEMIAQQQWFSKMVWASFGVTATELGYTEDAKGMSNQIVQSSVFRKRAIYPLLRIIEYHINKEIIPEFGHEGISFRFNMFDVEEETKKANLYKLQLETFKTPNEIRKDEGLDEVEDGDKLKSAPSPNTFNIGDGQSQSMRNQAGMEDDGKKPEEKALNTSAPISAPLFPKEGEEMDYYIKKQMKENSDKIIALLEKEDGVDQLKNLKGTKDVIDFLQNLITFEGLKAIADKAIRENFEKGWDKSEKRLNRNIELNREALAILQAHTFENIKGMTEEIANDLRGELERGFINGESITMLKDRVRKVFSVGEDRATMIARTESNRADNQGQLQAMRRSGETMTKTWLATEDDRTSALCNRLDGKTVGVNERFKDSVTGQEFDAPPSHVNCRSTLIFNFDTVEQKAQQAEAEANLRKMKMEEIDEAIRVAQKDKEMNILKKKESLLKKLEEDLNAGN